MKLNIVAFLVFIPLFTIAQKNQKIKLPIDSSTKLITYQEVVKVDGISKDDLYIRGREWFAKTFVSAKDVIQMEDKSAGKMIGKGSSSGYYSILFSIFTYYVNYTVSITVKDGRYRYEISHFLIQTAPTKTSGEYTYPFEEQYDKYAQDKGGVSMKLANKAVPHIQQVATDLIATLKKSMEQSTAGAKSKDDF